MNADSTGRDLRRGALALTRVPGVGAVTFRALVAALGDAEAVFRASPSALKDVPGCPRHVADAIRAFDEWAWVDAELDRLASLGGRLLVAGSSEYPVHLGRIHDPPPALYALGDVATEERRVIAVVGSRRATPYGTATASRLAQELAGSGFVVVSGMARGIDAAAHQGAMAGGGRTLAVLGCGVDVAYPPEMRGLKEQVKTHGAVLSEVPLGAPPDAHHFPTRNRIISGMSLGVLVVEATAESGSLITARQALEQGREVFAVPGNVGTPTSAGTNQLIKAGATLVETADDILDHLGGQLGAAPTRSAAVSSIAIELTDDESRVVDLLSWEPSHVDELTARAGLAPHRLAEVLLGLELKGMARQVPGRCYVRHPANS
ncbi:MAG TPA: DNA-processing protein DprA [Nitrospiria bacterium]|nr:DNA-processing protein DprA [Nitrospiria bacterium]